MALRKAATKSKAATSKAKKSTTTKATTKTASTCTFRTRAAQPPQEEEDHPPQEEEEENDGNHPSLEVLATAINTLTANAAETQDAIDKLKENFTSINEKLDTLTAAITANEPGRSASHPMYNNGNEPLPFIQTNLPWIDQSLLSNIVSAKLDPKDLIRLLSLKDRPKGRGNMQSGSLLLDIQTGKFTATEESATAFDKDFPDFNTALYALSVYGAIRTLYDVDKTGIGPAIFLYIKRLTRWVLIDKFYWPHIRAYIISHFRTYQASTNPLDWINTDVQLFTTHIRPTTFHSNPQTSRSQTSRKSPSKESTVCNNWNTEGKGCTWTMCVRTHRCSTCNSKEHPSYQCKQPLKKESKP